MKREIQGTTIGFIGGGNMARAILSGLVTQFPPSQLYVADRNEEKRNYFCNELKINSRENYHAFIDQVDVIVLAIKPQGFPKLIEELKDHVTADQLIISIAAGVPVETIDLAFGIEGLPIIRTMPNTPATIGLGATALFANMAVTPQQRAIAESIFTACGIAVWLEDEAEISAVIAVSGSSPAYFFYMMEIMTQVGESLGLSAENSEKLTKQAMLGAARFSQLSDRSLTQLKEDVMSPQGTTEQAIFSLEQDQFDQVLKRAMEAAYRRDQTLSEEIAKELSTQ